MENFIHKIFESKVDDAVHLQFQKFSRGEFNNKAIIEATASKGRFTISTTYEFANEFVKIVAEKLKGKTAVKGIIVSTRDLTGEIEFKDKKQFMGVKQYVVEKEMDKNEITGICNKLPSSFLALSFKADDAELKIKAKAPKSAKPSIKGEGAPKANFCKLATSDKELASDVLFDIDINNFKKAGINHTFLIKEIILPKGEKDFEKIRIFAKRKGKVVRKLSVDGKESVKEKEFVA